MTSMLTLIEVYVERAADADALISEELRKESGARVMTLEVAQQAGFSGFQPQLDKGQYRIIVVNRNESQWIQRSLEASSIVIGYQIHELYG